METSEQIPASIPEAVFEWIAEATPEELKELRTGKKKGFAAVADVLVSKGKLKKEDVKKTNLLNEQRTKAALNDEPPIDHPDPVDAKSADVRGTGGRGNPFLNIGPKLTFRMAMWLVQREERKLGFAASKLQIQSMHWMKAAGEDIAKAIRKEAKTKAKQEWALMGTAAVQMGVNAGIMAHTRPGKVNKEYGKEKTRLQEDIAYNKRKQSYLNRGKQPPTTATTTPPPKTPETTVTIQEAGKGTTPGDAARKEGIKQQETEASIDRATQEKKSVEFHKKQGEQQWRQEEVERYQNDTRTADDIDNDIKAKEDELSNLTKNGGTDWKNTENNKLAGQRQILSEFSRSVFSTAEHGIQATYATEIGFWQALQEELRSVQPLAKGLVDSAAQDRAEAKTVGNKALDALDSYGKQETQDFRLGV